MHRSGNTGAEACKVIGASLADSNRNWRNFVIFSAELQLD